MCILRIRGQESELDISLRTGMRACNKFKNNYAHFGSIKIGMRARDKFKNRCEIYSTRNIQRDKYIDRFAELRATLPVSATAAVGLNLSGQPKLTYPAVAHALVRASARRRVPSYSPCHDSSVRFGFSNFSKQTRFKPKDQGLG